MPGVTPRGMNGYSDLDHVGPPVRGSYPPVGANGFDPYHRDDMYRDDVMRRADDDDPYRRPARNGRPASDRFNADHLADQNSLSDFNTTDPSFELDHLATFAAGSRKGTMHVEDGLRKLRQMENTTGIWTMRCILQVERRYIVILDKNSGEELERFPVQFVQEPTAIFKNDRREIYNNLILFTVVDESNKRDGQADMHIFQSVRTPAQIIVDEVVAAKKGNPRLTGAGYKIPPPPSGPAPEPPGQARDPYDFGDMRQTVEQHQFGYGQQGVSYFGGGGGLIGGAQRSSMMAHLPYREREDIESSNNELLERDVQLLNHCFDDVEKFVARLQQAAEAYKELEKRKRDRSSKNKKKQNGDGMLGFRARPPPAQDFVDIFQKFKLSFNLLAKLKAHIHDPNAPELVHFLFTPLSLIYEASRDPVHGSTNLGEQAVAPVLTQDAKQLLLNCLTSKEIELWQALGKNWTTSKDEWKGPVPPYVPRFYDGWQPAPMVIEDPAVRPQMEPGLMPHHDQIRGRGMEGPVHSYFGDRGIPFTPGDDRQERFQHIDDYDRFDTDHRAPTPPRNPVNNPAVAGYQANFRAQEPRRPEPTLPTPSPNPSRGPVDDNTAYLEELRRTGAIIFEVLHDRQGKNPKELTVHKGEYLQVLDNSRNWWKVRNYKGEAGFCPYTILKELSGGGADGPRDLSAAVDPMMDHASAVGAPAMSKASRRETTDKGWERNPHVSPLQSPLTALDTDDDVDSWHAFRPVEPALYGNRGGVGLYKNEQQDQLTKELRNRMVAPRALEPQHYSPPPPPPSAPSGPSGSVSPRYLDTQSVQDEVTAWLEAKGFSAECRHALAGFTGRDIFALHRHEMESMIGREEAARLEGQLTLQKKMTGYKTQSAAELQAIFNKRRAKNEHRGNVLGQPPAFHPETPSSREGQDSDSDEDDLHLADTGKTLRDLLIRQRQKISGANIFDQGSG